MREIRDPASPDEWEAVVGWAACFLVLDAARQYGLITGGPAADVARCRTLLERGAALGYTPPTGEAFDRLLVEFVGSLSSSARRSDNH